MTSQTGIKTEDIISTLQYLDMIKVSPIVCSGVQNDLPVNLSVSLLGLERPARDLCETRQYRRIQKEKVSVTDLHPHPVSQPSSAGSNSACANLNSCVGHQGQHHRKRQGSIPLEIAKRDGKVSPVVD